MNLSKSTYRKLAHLVGVFHWIWIAILFFGIFIQMIFPWYSYINLAIVITTAVSQILWGGCPLVTLQNALAAKYNPDTVYYGSFVYHQLKKIGITVPPIVIALQMIVLLILSFIFVFVF